MSDWTMPDDCDGLCTKCDKWPCTMIWKYYEDYHNQCAFMHEHRKRIEKVIAERDAWEMIFADLKRRIAEYDSERDAQQKRIAELEKQIQKTRDNFYAADRLNIETQKTTTIQFSSMISRYVDQCGDQQERIADLEHQVEIGDEALTMLQENHDGEMEKLNKENERLREWWTVALDWLQALTANARIIEHYEPSELEKIHNLIKYANEALDSGGDDE